MGASRDFLTFFDLGFRVRPPTDFHAKWLKRRVFTQGCAFFSKNRIFSYPLISRAKVKILQSFWLRKFLLDLAFNIRGPEREHPLFFIGAQWKWHKIVNRQSGDEKLKYVLKFCIGDTCHVIRACAMTIQHCVYEDMMFGAEYLGPKDHQ